LTDVEPNRVAASVVADVADVRDVVWEEGQTPLAMGAGLAPGEIAIRSGTLRLNARGDAAVYIVGPARIKLISANRILAVAGRLTARVGPNGKGFVVETPGAQVIDLGTEFGVQVEPPGETAVVVFEGAVDLKPNSAATSATGSVPTTKAATEVTRLTRGQAVHVSRSGEMARIAAVVRNAGAVDWEVDLGGASNAVIASVRDNIRDPAGAKFYQIVRHGLAEDVRAYVDRVHEWNGVDASGIPSQLLGADLVMTFNDDKRAYDLEISVTLARPATLYVFFKRHGPDIPDWLRRDFVDTGMVIGMDEGPPDLPNSTLAKGPGNSIERVFHVWRRDVLSPGTVTLGPNIPGNNSMYGVAAVALPSTPVQR
jgi:hypothetical protein